MDIFIYCLVDPITHEIKYVGKTVNLKKRLNRHIIDSKKSTNTHKKAWINKLLKCNLKPIIEVIDIVRNDDWGFWEEYWISQFKCWGFTLLNICKGGEGVDVGNVPWNKGIKGSIKKNKTTFKKGNKIGEKTRIKKGQKLGIATQFKKGSVPLNIKQVQQYSLDMVLLSEFKTVKDAAKATNIRVGNIRKAASGNGKTAGGYIWKYL